MLTIIGNPTNHNERVKKLQLLEVKQFGLHQNYQPSDADDLIELANEMADDPGDVTIVLLQTL